MSETDVKIFDEDPKCYNQMTDREKEIWNAVKKFSIKNPVLSRNVTASIKLSNRLLAACVRKMNEKYKGYLHIGSDKTGYWPCKDEEEALASLSSYEQTIVSMLGEKKKKIEQIRITFGIDRNLFDERVLSQQV